MITSKQNSLIKEIRSLSSKKFRDNLGLFVVEGIKPVREALDLSVPFYAVVGTEKGFDAFESDSIIFSDDLRCEIVSEDVFSYISEEKSPQGVLAVLYKPENKIVPHSGNCLFLDGVADPSNVGAVIRTAVAMDYKTIYMTDECADPFSNKAVRASMSCVLRACIVRGQRNELLEVIDKPLVVADMNGTDLSDFSCNDDFCLVIGNEGNGVSKEIKERADYTLSIKMFNNVESLNASVSAGILMYCLKLQK